MTSPHRSAPLTADLSLEIDGIPYSARVMLTHGKLPKRSVELSVVQPRQGKVERASCVACAYLRTARVICAAKQSGREARVTGRCVFFTPSLLTRLLRALRLGRPAVYLAAPQPVEDVPGAPARKPVSGKRNY